MVNFANLADGENSFFRRQLASPRHENPTHGQVSAHEPIDFGTKPIFEWDGERVVSTTRPAGRRPRRSRFDPVLKEILPVPMEPRRSRRPRVLYSVQDQAPDAPLWAVIDRSTGQAQVYVRGSTWWVQTQAQLWAQARGYSFLDVKVEVVDDHAK